MDSHFEPPRVVSAARAYLDRGAQFERAGTLERALGAYRDALSANATPIEQAEARLCIARVYRSMNAYQHAREESAEAIRIATDQGAEDLAAEAMNIEIGSLQMQGFFEDAEKLAMAALERARSPRVRGITLQNLGRGAAERKDFERSDRFFDESIVAFREADYETGLAIALANAARAALDRGDVRRSLEIGHEAVSISRRLNLLDNLGTAVQNQAEALVAVRDLEGAESLLTEALGHFTSARNVIRQAECLEVMGRISELRSDLETANRCYVRARDLAISANDVPLIERMTEILSRRE